MNTDELNLDLSSNEDDLLNITIQQSKEAFISQYRRDFNPVNALIRLGVAPSEASILGTQYLADPYVQSRLSDLSEIDSPLRNPQRTRAILAEKLYSLGVDDLIDPKVRVNAIGMLLKELPSEDAETSDKIILPSTGMTSEEWSNSVNEYTEKMNALLDNELKRIEHEKGAEE